MDNLNKLDRKQECKLLTDFINENYAGKVCEVQNVFLEQGRRVPYIGIVNKATPVITRLHNLPPNIYIAIEIRTTVNIAAQFPMSPTRYQEICSVCIPPNPLFIQTTCDNITNVVLQMDKTWQKMREMINSVMGLHIAYHKQDNEIEEEWQIE